METQLKVAVVGAHGRMGKAVCEAVFAAPDMELVATLDAGDTITTESLCGAEAVVEFTVPSCAKANVLAILEAGANAVVGTTGWDDDSYWEVAEKAVATGKNCFIAPNFAMSAVLVMEFARLAAPYFESAEVIEMHHPNKVDAPSGTAVATAEKISQARKETSLGGCPDATESALPGARGAVVDEVSVHAVRMRGATAHQEVLFGNDGEIFTLRTDCFGQNSFMPGVLLALREVEKHPGLTVGLDKLLALGGK